MNRLRVWLDESWMAARLFGPFWRFWYGMGPGRLATHRRTKRQREELSIAARHLHPDDVANWSWLRARQDLAREIHKDDDRASP